MRAAAWQFCWPRTLFPQKNLQDQPRQQERSLGHDFTPLIGIQSSCPKDLDTSSSERKGPTELPPFTSSITGTAFALETTFFLISQARGKIFRSAHPPEIFGRSALVAIIRCLPRLRNLGEASQEGCDRQSHIPRKSRRRARSGQNKWLIIIAGSQKSAKPWIFSSFKLFLRAVDQHWSSSVPELQNLGPCFSNLLWLRATKCTLRSWRSAIAAGDRDGERVHSLERPFDRLTWLTLDLDQRLRCTMSW